MRRETKRCSKCGQEKALSAFWKNRRSPDGRYAHCKLCGKKIAAAYRARNRKLRLIEGGRLPDHPAICIRAERIGTEEIQTVDARDLWRFLGSRREFSTWIKERIRDYKFEQNQDFIIFDKIVKNSKRGRPSTEYHVSLDMAKELSMVERTERGRQARRYFIECERKLIKLLQTPAAKPEKLPLAALPHMHPAARKFLVDSPSMQKNVSDMITILDLKAGRIGYFVNMFIKQIDYLKPWVDSKTAA